MHPYRVDIDLSLVLMVSYVHARGAAYILHCTKFAPQGFVTRKVKAALFSNPFAACIK
jgi:hypothetical protein